MNWLLGITAVIQAFLMAWLIKIYRQQRDIMAQQRDEMRRQAEAMDNQRVAMEAQARTMREQAKIMGETLAAIQKGVEAAQETNRLSREGFTQTHRPRLRVRNVVVMPTRVPGSPNSFIPEHSSAATSR